MGYETRFKLTVLTSHNHSQRDYLKVLTKINPQEFSPKTNSFEEKFKKPCKWYNYEDNMKELSLIFSDSYFLLYGIGEEQGDAWKAYFYNGTVKTLLMSKNEPLITEIRNLTIARLMPIRRLKSSLIFK